MKKELPKNQKDILNFVKEENVQFIEIWFSDILGFLKSFTITPRELPKAFEEGLGFDGSSVRGYT
ncbi:MAG: glutamine synthetase beta-grasp domain-containing protein, partial [Dictyoglomus sp.]